MAVHQHIIAETLGEEDGLALIHESGVVKQWDQSVGVGPQYCGSVGKVANLRVGVYLGYVSRKGYSVVANRLLTLGQWFGDEHAGKRRASGVPEDLVFKTQPQIVLALLQEALHRGGLPFQWVAADALYVGVPAFWNGVTAMGKWYFTEIACSTLIWHRRPAVCVPPWCGRGKRPTSLRLRTPSHRSWRVDSFVAHIPKKSWTRHDQTRQQGTAGV